MDNSKDNSTQNTHGAVVKLLGVILIILGSLNTMLSWRGGFDVLSLPVFLITAGLVFFLIGFVLHQRNE